VALLEVLRQALQAILHPFLPHKVTTAAMLSEALRRGILLVVAVAEPLL
jgi:hypothetical protein